MNYLELKELEKAEIIKIHEAHKNILKIKEEVASSKEFIFDYFKNTIKYFDPIISEITYLKFPNNLFHEFVCHHNKCKFSCYGEDYVQVSSLNCEKYSLGVYKVGINFIKNGYEESSICGGEYNNKFDFGNYTQKSIFFHDDIKNFIDENWNYEPSFELMCEINKMEIPYAIYYLSYIEFQIKIGDLK